MLNSDSTYCSHFEGSTTHCDCAGCLISPQKIHEVAVLEGENSPDSVVGGVWRMVVGQGSHKQQTLSITRNMVI